MMRNLKESAIYDEMLLILQEEYDEAFISKWGCETAEKIFRRGFMLAMEKGYFKFKEVAIECMKDASVKSAGGEYPNFQRIFNEKFWGEGSK